MMKFFPYSYIFASQFSTMCMYYICQNSEDNNKHNNKHKCVDNGKRKALAMLDADRNQMGGGPGEMVWGNSIYQISKMFCG